MTAQASHGTATESAIGVGSVFLNNMAALWATESRLAQQIDDLPADAGVEVEPSRAGPVTARMPGESGRMIYLQKSQLLVRDPESGSVERLPVHDLASAIEENYGISRELAARALRAMG